MPSIVLAAVMAIVSLLLGNPFHSLGFGMVAAVFMVGGMLFMCMGFLGISWVPLRRSTRTAAVDHQRAVRRNRWNIGYRGCATYAELVPMKVAYTAALAMRFSFEAAVVLSARRRHRLNG